MLKAFIVFLAFISEGFTSQAELVQLERIGEQKKQAGVKLLTACHDLSETIQKMHNLEMKCAEANYAIEVTQITLHSFLLYKKTLSKLITELKGIKLEDENSQAYDYLVADNILSLFDDLRAQFKEQEDNLIKKKYFGGRTLEINLSKGQEEPIIIQIFPCSFHDINQGALEQRLYTKRLLQSFKDTLKGRVSVINTALENNASILVKLEKFIKNSTFRKKNFENVQEEALMQGLMAIGWLKKSAFF